MRIFIYSLVLLCLITIWNPMDSSTSTTDHVEKWLDETPCTLTKSIPGKRIVIRADTMLDGKGHILKNTRIVVEGVKIVALNPKAGPIDYDLRGLTVLPGWIDAHAHIT